MKIADLQVGPIGTNCYVVYDETERVCAIVDPGGEAARVADTVSQTGCKPVCILLTHGHYDHVGGVAKLQKAYPGIPVYVNERDRYPEDSPARHLFPALHGDIRNYDEGDTVSVGSMTFTVLATPGHTEGSVTLQVEDVLFCGDTLFAGSCGRTDFVGGSTEEMLASLRRLGQLEGDYQVFPGHMDPTDLSCERSMNPCMLQALQS